MPPLRVKSTAMSQSKAVYRVMAPKDCELKSIAVHAEAVSFLLGQDSCTSKRLLCDEVCALLYLAILIGLLS